MLSTGALLLGPEGVVGGEGGCSTLSSASTGCPLWCLAWGLVVLLLSKFCIMILPYFLSFYFLVVILSGDRQPVLVPVLVQLLVAVLVVEDSTLLK